MASSALKSAATKCLFGRGDANENALWLRKKLTEIQREHSARWNFDFASGRPLLEGKSAWQWHRESSASLPAFYSSSASACSSDAAAAQSPTKKHAVRFSPIAKPASATGDAETPRKPVAIAKPSVRSARRLRKPSTLAVSRQICPITGYFPTRKRSLASSTAGTSPTLSEACGECVVPPSPFKQRRAARAP